MGRWRIAALVAALMLGGCAEALRQDVTRRDAPLGTERLMSPAPHAFHWGRVEKGNPVRRGALSERFELRDGDCGGSDCANPRARAEVQTARDANPARMGEDIWYGWSFLNANVPSFDKDNSLRLVFGQWTAGGGNRPIFRLIQLGRGEGDFDGCDPRVCAGPASARGDVAVQLQDIAEAYGWGDAQNDGYVCRLFDLADRRGRWVDLVVNTNFAPGRDGYLRIWVDGRLACDYRGPLVSPATLAAGQEPRHRRGIYSSWTKRWSDAFGNRPRPSLVVYYDEFRTGTHRGAVDVAHLAAVGAPPVD